MMHFVNSVFLFALAVTIVKAAPPNSQANSRARASKEASAEVVVGPENEAELLAEIFGEAKTSGSNGNNGVGAETSGRARSRTRVSGETGTDEVEEVFSTLGVNAEGEETNSTDPLTQVFGSSEIRPVKVGNGTESRITVTEKPDELPSLPTEQDLKSVMNQITNQLKSAGAVDQLSGAIGQLKSQFGPALGNADFKDFDVQGFMANFMKNNNIQPPPVTVKPEVRVPLPSRPEFVPVRPGGPETVSELGDLTAALNTQMARSFGNFLAQIQQQVSGSGVLSDAEATQFDTIRKRLQTGRGLQRDAKGAIDFASLFGSAQNNPMSKLLTTSFNNFIKSSPQNTGPAAIKPIPLPPAAGGGGLGGVLSGLAGAQDASQLQSMLALMSGTARGLDLGSVFSQGNPGQSLTSVLSETLQGAVSQSNFGQAVSQLTGNFNGQSNPSVNARGNANANANLGVPVRGPAFPRALYRF